MARLRLRTEARPPDQIHDGIVAALLDGAIVRAILLEAGFENLMVTAKMELAFRLATPTRQPVTISGRVVKRCASRAQAECPADVSAAWTEERRRWRVDAWSP